MTDAEAGLLAAALNAAERVNKAIGALNIDERLDRIEEARRAVIGEALRRALEKRQREDADDGTASG